MIDSGATEEWCVKVVAHHVKLKESDTVKCVPYKSPKRSFRIRICFPLFVSNQREISIYPQDLQMPFGLFTVGSSIASKGYNVVTTKGG